MKKATREWLRKADADLAGARTLARRKPPLHDLVCFHCQQAAEQYLKGLLEEIGHAIAKTHDLVALLKPLQPHYPFLKSLRRGLSFLTQFAVEIRYPGENATRRQSQAALRWARRVQATVRCLLGVKPRRKR